ncbi:MAG: class I SAM-dependent methyltransferase [Acidobacteriota bacterium]|nr:MAG: class I SAM-dependent methyltransferase [Acidobacteriota bacterium]
MSDGDWSHLDRARSRTERPLADRTRDADRLPVGVLRFCGIRPGAVVVDLMAGAGYYTEILSAAVGPQGRVYGHNSPFVLARYAEKPWSERLARLPYDNVTRVDAEPELIRIDEPADIALLIRFYHDFYWQNVDRAAFNASVMATLRPGGIFCVLDHHAEPGSRDRDVKTLHRVDAAMVREEIESAGFVFDGESDILRNPGDDRSWNIFANDAMRRDKTDRFLYRFRKPDD